MKKIQTLISFLLLINCFGCIETPTELKVDPNEPIAVLGENQTVTVGNYIVFDGSKSSKGNGDTLIYRWSQDLSNPEQFIFYSSSDFYDAAVKEGTYRYSLVVNNGIVDSKPAQLIVTVTPRRTSIISDIALEASLRFAIKKQTGDLGDADYLSIDSLYTGRGFLSSIKVKTLNGIERCRNLKQLGVSSQSVSDLSPLTDMSNLEKLKVDQNHLLSDVKPLKNLVNLKYLDISDNHVTDISSLAGLTNLTDFFILGSPEYHVSDISVVANFKRLKSFMGAFWVQPDLSVFTSLSDLEVFYCSYSKINNLTGFKNCVKLRELYLTANEITDLTPICGLQELQLLWLGGSKIEDITPLQNLEKLKSVILDDNLVKDLKPLVDNKGIGVGTTIMLRNNPLSEQSLNEYIPQLIARGIYIIK